MKNPFPAMDVVTVINDAVNCYGRAQLAMGERDSDLISLGARAAAADDARVALSSAIWCLSGSQYDRGHADGRVEREAEVQALAAPGVNLRRSF
jgi:hypothetical protein